jgi:hypothetical protein
VRWLGILLLHSYTCFIVGGNVASPRHDSGGALAVSVDSCRTSGLINSIQFRLKIGRLSIEQSRLMFLITKPTEPECLLLRE